MFVTAIKSTSRDMKIIVFKVSVLLLILLWYANIVECYLWNVLSLTFVTNRCSCCDSYCGPTNGCNCSYCMKLDVEARKLPKGWFVNRDGHACRVSRETGHTYCGRLMMESSQLCDGYCGPTNGPNCQSCRIMDHQLINRYHSVWQH